ncbi:hypothetical protein [Komagataeibacter rhaeticus]|uniref:hypothetical protein n=1 Tax=Komagataeibacter rhaeticus TaxID=215221 RepID=UPI0005590066|nr:hypothetical protein [Komagataeibacter rhaeticus]
MRRDETVIVAARHPPLEPGLFQMTARPIDTSFGHTGNRPIRRAPSAVMHMRMAGIVVVDRNPIEFRAEIGFDLRHQVAGVARQVGEIPGILRRNDEPELMPVILSAIEKGITIGAILGP